MSEDMEKFQKDVNNAFREEGERAVRADIAAGKKRLHGIRAALRALDRFLGDGLADEMPLGEAIGFLEVRLEDIEAGNDFGISREDIEHAHDFLDSIVGEEYPGRMELGSLVTKLQEEEKEILV